MAAHNSINEYYASNPVDLELTKFAGELFFLYVANTFIQSRQVKKGDKALIEATGGNTKQITRVKRLVKQGYFKKALEPITKGSISSVKLQSVNSRLVRSVSITEENVGDLLPDDQMILSQFKDGDRVPLSGELQMLGSTHGDSMKIKIRDIDPENSLLTATLADGLDIVNYANMFKQAVFIDAEISRKTMFKRPELVVHKMTLLQEQLQLKVA